MRVPEPHGTHINVRISFDPGNHRFHGVPIDCWFGATVRQEHAAAVHGPTARNTTDDTTYDQVALRNRRIHHASLHKQVDARVAAVRLLANVTCGPSTGGDSVGNA